MGRYPKRKIKQEETADEDTPPVRVVPPANCNHDDTKDSEDELVFGGAPVITKRQKPQRGIKKATSNKRIQELRARRGASSGRGNVKGNGRRRLQVRPSSLSRTRDNQAMNTRRNAHDDHSKRWDNSSHTDSSGWILHGDNPTIPNMNVRAEQLQISRDVDGGNVLDKSVRGSEAMEVDDDVDADDDGGSE